MSTLPTSERHHLADLSTIPCTDKLVQTMTTQEGTIGKIPMEIIRGVIGWLNYSDTIRFCRTSSMYHKICKGDEFWGWKTRHDFGSVAELDEIHKDET